MKKAFFLAVSLVLVVFLAAAAKMYIDNRSLVDVSLPVLENDETLADTSEWRVYSMLPNEFASPEASIFEKLFGYALVDEEDVVERAPIEGSEFTYEQALDTLQYWDNWTWEEKLLKIRISTVNAENSTVIGTVVRPDDHVLAGTEQSFLVKCPAEETAFHLQDSAEDLEPILEDSEVLLNAASGDHLYSFCLDKSCDRVGSSCVVQKY